MKDKRRNNVDDQTYRVIDRWQLLHEQLLMQWPFLGSLRLFWWRGSGGRVGGGGGAIVGGARRPFYFELTDLRNQSRRRSAPFSRPPPSVRCRLSFPTPAALNDMLDHVYRNTDNNLHDNRQDDNHCNRLHNSDPSIFNYLQNNFINNILGNEHGSTQWCVCELPDGLPIMRLYFRHTSCIPADNCRHRCTRWPWISDQIIDQWPLPQHLAKRPDKVILNYQLVSKRLLLIDL